MSAVQNPTIKVLLDHVSVRDFTTEAISQEMREAILEATRATSTSCFLQAVTVIRVTDAEMRKKLAHYSGDQPHVETAPEFWVFCADYHRDERICGEVDLGWTEQLIVGCTDAAIMAQNALTAAEGLGLGGCLIGGIRTQIKEASELLGLPKNTFPVLGLVLGHPATKNAQKPRLPMAIFCNENTYREPSETELATYEATLVDYYQTREPAKHMSAWADKLNPILKRERRPFMRDYLNAQGWLLK